MDGTIADLASAYHAVERALFGDRAAPVVPGSDIEEIEEGEQEQALEARAAVRAARTEALERDVVWDAIRQTEDFWLSQRPLEDGAVRRLYEASVTHGWEVSFVTQRPRTEGQTVQRQTQQWLVREGFEMPSVLTLRGGRGKAAAALELDFLLDDYPKNCVDVVSDSR
jgi:phosphoglycolate phosphatase-like HAD superfamily hydrolase